MPLIGEQGWAEDGTRAVSNHVPGRDKTLPEMIAEAAEPLPDLDDNGFGKLFDRFADRRVILLGDASHGTSEFYRARASITRHLIERHSFTIVAVEADWPDAAAVDRFVRHKPARPGTDRAFERFPTWMWRNEELSAPASTVSTSTTCAARSRPCSPISMRLILSPPQLRGSAMAA